jgi:hypothetical protein
LLSVAVAAVAGLRADAQPDYNRDCVANFSDSIAFMNDYAAHAPAADLNLDGAVNQADFDSFSESRAKTNFTIYWQTSTVLQPGQTIDTQTDLTGIPLSRNSAILYQQRFPKIPIRYGPDSEQLEAGFHMMFRDASGSYTNWRASYDAWLALHHASLPALVATEMPSPAFNGLVCIDWEVVTPLRQQMVNEPAAIVSWDQMVEQINSPAYDRAFLAFSEWTPPAASTGWGDLSAAQRTEFVNQAHRKVGLAFYISTVQSLRTLRPNAKYCYYGQPAGAWLVYDEERRAHNELLAPLWPELDVLAPSTYPLFWTTTDPSTSPCPEAVNGPGQNSAFFQALLQECTRIKTTYPRPGQQIITYASWHYKLQAGSCSPDITPSLFVNDWNLIQQLQLPWWFGADGVALWGHYPRGGFDNPTTVGAELRARWREPIRRLVCPD